MIQKAFNYLFQKMSTSIGTYVTDYKSNQPNNQLLVVTNTHSSKIAFFLHFKLDFCSPTGVSDTQPNLYEVPASQRKVTKSKCNR